MNTADDWLTARPTAHARAGPGRVPVS